MATHTVGSPRHASRPASDDDSADGVLPLGDSPPFTRAPADPRDVLGAPPPTDRLRGWIVTAVVTLVAAVVRFAGLGHPTDGGTPVFDEKHYVPQAWQMLRNGGVEDNPGFELVVHPPLGKQLIAIGELVFGYNGVGWRVAAALAGVLCVFLLVRVARRLTRSTLLGAIAGVLLICDGLSQVQSRMGMLDIFSALFVLAAFTTLVCDRDDVRARMAVVVAEGRVHDSPFGPRMGVRWWRLATGVLLGLALGYAETVGAFDLFIGANVLDYSGYPDCRDEFVKALNHAVNLGMAKETRFETPLMWLDKAETWALADYWGKLDLVRSETLTCYNGIKGDGCGQCAACNLRANGLNHYLADKVGVMAAMKQKTGLK